MGRVQLLENGLNGVAGSVLADLALMALAVRLECRRHGCPVVVVPSSGKERWKATARKSLHCATKQCPLPLSQVRLIQNDGRKAGDRAGNWALEGF